MRAFLIVNIIIISLLPNYVLSQNVSDSLLNELEIIKEDTNKVLLLNNIYSQYKNNDTKQALNYATEALILSKKIKYTKGIAVSNYNIGRTNSDIGNFRKALEFLDESSYESIADLSKKIDLSTVMLYRAIDDLRDMDMIDNEKLELTDAGKIARL